jgi:hypothetical protein
MSRTSGVPARRRARRTRAIAFAVAITVVVACAACGGGSTGGAGSSSSASTSSASTSSASTSSGGASSKAALEYGLGPERNSHVNFQSDVVIVAGGPDAIRSVSDGGLTWTIDGNASGAEQLEPGKIMFVTGRAVGRVLAIKDAGSDRKVTIGPVSITDVIRDGKFAESGISLSNATEHQGVAPNWETSAAAQATTTAMVTPEPAHPARPVELMAAHNEPPSARLTAAGAATKLCCSEIHGPINYDSGGVKVFGSADLSIAKPAATFRLDIRGGSVTYAELKITGGISLHVDFQAGIEGDKGTRTFPVALGSDFSVPIGLVLGVPLAVTVHQGLTITTAFAAKIGTIRGSGTFSLGTAIGYAFDGSKFSNLSAISFKRQTSLINSLTGVPVGVMGLVIDHQIKFTVGFSAFVLTAGVFVSIDTAIGVTRGSGLGAALAECQGVAIGVHAKFGIGYTILKPVANAINAFLSLLNVKPIKQEGGIKSPLFDIVVKDEVIPPGTKLCGDTG